MAAVRTSGHLQAASSPQAASAEAATPPTRSMLAVGDSARGAATGGLQQYPCFVSTEEASARLQQGQHTVQRQLTLQSAVSQVGREHSMMLWPSEHLY